MTVTRVKWSARTRGDQAGHARANHHRVVAQLAIGAWRGDATVAVPAHSPRQSSPSLPILGRHDGALLPSGTVRQLCGDYSTPAWSHRRGRRDETWLAAAGRRASWSLAADGLQEVHHELVDPLGGVGLYPVAGLGDPLNPHLRDPGPVRLGQLPTQVAVLVPQMTKVGMSTRRTVCAWARGLARTAAR